MYDQMQGAFEFKHMTHANTYKSGKMILFGEYDVYSAGNATWKS